MANDIGGVWRTIGGRRVFIKDGQSLASAMKDSGKFNSSSNNKAKKGDSVLENFKNSDGSKENFEKALNKISEMEYNNEINPDEYKEYISKIQKEYVEKNKKTNNDDYEYNLYKQAKENPDSINPMTEWSTDWEDLDKRFKDRYAKENSKYKYSVDGQKITEAEFKAEYDKQKKLGNIDKDMTYDDYKQGIVDDRNSNVRSLKNDLTADERLQYLKEHNKFVKENQKNDLMTAEQLKGKDREEQKEINKQYLKEQNKLAREKTLLAQIQEETDSYAYKELLREYNAGKVTTTDLEDTLKTLKKFNGDNEDKANIDTNFAKEWYEGTKKTENMAKDNLERAKRNGASVEELSNRTRQVHELELESQKAQEHSNKMNAKVNTPVTQLSDLRDRFYKAKSDRENNQIREYTKSALEAVKEGTTLGLVVKESTAGWTNMGGWHDENTTVKKYTKIGPNKWDTPYGVKTDEDMVLTALYNNEPLRDLQEANNIAGIKSMSDKSSFRYYGNSGPNRVTYKNQSSNNVMNNSIRNAYEEYKKKHPGSKINFSDFKDNYKS